MSGYNEVFQIMGALVLFSLIALTSNRQVLTNVEKVIGSEVENRAVTIAQDYIDHAKLLSFDHSTLGGKPDDIPGDFTYPIPETSAQSLSEMTNLNDFNGYSETLGGDLGVFRATAQVHYVDEPTFTNAVNWQTSHKRIRVSVTSETQQYPVTLEYIRSYY